MAESAPQHPIDTAEVVLLGEAPEAVARRHGRIRQRDVERDAGMLFVVLALLVEPSLQGDTP